MRAWGLLGLTIALEVTATLSLADARTHPGLYAVVVAGYLSSFYVLSLVLRYLPLGVAYGIWGACGVALAAVCGAWLFRDPLTPTMLVGIGLIVVGVLTVEFGRQHAEGRTRAAATVRGVLGEYPTEDRP